MDQCVIEERLSRDAPLGADTAVGELEVRHFASDVVGRADDECLLGGEEREA